MDDAPYSGPERRADQLGREAFELAVTAAAKAATQEVARVHRVRLVTQAAIASFLVAVLVAMGVAYLLTRDQQERDRQNAQGNCRLVRDLTGTMGAFVQSDATLRRQQAAFGRTQQVVTPFRKIFGGDELRSLQAQSAVLDKRTFDYWQYQIVPRLDGIARIDCTARLK